MGYGRNGKRSTKSENMKENEIKKHETGDIGIVLNRLADLLERTLVVFEETRQKSLDNHNYFKGLMESHHEEDSTISEDGLITCVNVLFTALPPESVADITTDVLPADPVGVPVIAPVDVLKDSPV